MAPINAPLPDLLRNRGLETPASALRLVPCAYEDFATIHSGYGGLPVGERICVAGTLFRRVALDTSREVAKATFVLTDGVWGLDVSATGAQAWAFYRGDFDIGDRLYVRAMPQEIQGSVVLSGAQLLAKDAIGAVVPHYPGDKEGILSKLLPQYLAVPGVAEEAAAEILNHFYGMPEATIFEMARLEDWKDLTHFVRDLHCPPTGTMGGKARKAAYRLAALEVVAHARNMSERLPQTASALKLNPSVVESLIKAMPYQLTGDQRQSINEMVADLLSPVPMRRLLSGDVGTGKTIAFGVPAAAAQLAGHRVVIMTPNLLVSEQHVKHFRQWWPHIPVKLVVGDTRLKSADLANNPILIGTTALISRLKKQDLQPDFMVVDEQHKLSKEQRETLVGPATNFLEATATCIPRTSAIIQYGGMDISLLKQCPVQKQITTRIFRRTDRQDLFQRIRRILANGDQVAVIYPRIEAKEEGDRLSLETAVSMWESQFPGNVRHVHGRMTDDDKNEVIEAMKAGEFKILISTIVIEVGVTLPELRALVVVHADRYGLAQLHQLRGRVARLGGAGGFYMYLPEDEIKDDTLERLRLLTTTNDGFELAERDLDLRGLGDLRKGTKQHGKAVATGLLGIEIKSEDIRAVLKAQVA